MCDSLSSADRVFGRSGCRCNFGKTGSIRGWTASWPVGQGGRSGFASSRGRLATDLTASGCHLGLSINFEMLRSSMASRSAATADRFVQQLSL